MDTIRCRQFRVARRYRRQAAPSLSLRVVVAAGLAGPDDPLGPHQFAPGLGLIAAACLPVASLVRWRPREDDGPGRRP